MEHPTEITSQLIDLLRDRFGTFHHSIIEDITILVNRSKKEQEIIVKISAPQRIGDTEHIDWFYLTIRVIEPLFYSINLRENYYLGDILRINFHATQKGVFIDFYPPHQIEQNPYDYYKALSEKGTGFLFMAAKKGYILIEKVQK